MPRPPAKEIPRWRRGTQQQRGGVQLTSRHARAFAREYAREAARLTVAPDAAPVNDVLARTGAWRFRRHLAPFIWIGCLLLAVIGLRRTDHPLLYAAPAGLAVPLLMVWGTRHLSAYAVRTAAAWGILTSIWLPSLVSLGFPAPLPGLLALNWAVCAALWVRHYRWRPAAAAEPAAEAAPDTSDAAVWGRLAAERRWNGILGPAEELGGGGRRYPVQLDGIKTTIGSVLAASENIAGAWHKPMTEAYAERDPLGITSRGYLTILGRESLMRVREWDGTGMDPLTGAARFARFADGSDSHLKLYTPRYGTRHGLISGTTGSGKSELLHLLTFIALMSGCFVPVILDPQEGQSLPFWRDRCLYAAGVDECHRVIRGLHAGMLGRSRYLSGLRWDDDGDAMHGMPFFDYALTGLPMPLIIFDEAHMALKGTTKGERGIIEDTVEIARLGRKTGTGLWLATHIPGLTDLGGEQALRDMLRGGNVVSMRTANRVGGPMLGLEKDPSEIPKFFADGKETYGLGYTAGPDNRPDAPMRSDLVPKAMRRKVPPVPRLDDRFLEAMDRAMGTQGVLLPRDAVPPPEADDQPAGRRCIDAVWQVLSDAGKPMERGEVIKWVNELVTTGWSREKPFTIRSITSALTSLTAGDGGRVITKIRDGVYQAAGKDSQC